MNNPEKIIQIVSNEFKEAKEAVEKLSDIKKEESWMREIRINALEIFYEKQIPKWLPDAKNFENKLKEFILYNKPFESQKSDWKKVPKEIKEKFDALGIPEKEKEFFAGSSAQYESEMVYHNLKKQWEEKGVIFKSMDLALKENPEIVKKYFGKIVPSSDNKFAALNTAFWSGGSFVYVPKNISIDFPLQTYFKINTEKMAQFERSLIIGEENSKFHYIEGCSAPIYSTASLHSAVVEVFANPYSQIRYTTIQNWSKNVYNLVTKRAIAHDHSYVEWVDGNIGSKITSKYPCVILKGPFAKTNIISVAYAAKDQLQDSGAKAIHLAPNTSSQILSKGICIEGGKQIFRGLIDVKKGAKNSKSNMVCDTLMLDDSCYSEAHPKLKVDEDQVKVSHEASVGKIGEDELFYLMSRGLSEEDAISLIIMGFIEPFAKELPLEYAVELNRLISLDLDKSQHQKK